MQKNGIIFDGESPTKGVKLPKFDNRRMRFLSSDEANSLLDELKNILHDVLSDFPFVAVQRHEVW